MLLRNCTHAALLLSEDTFLLLDALEQDKDELRAAKPSICLEIGSGSGAVTAFLGGILGGSSACRYPFPIALILCPLPSDHSSSPIILHPFQIPIDPIQTTLVSGLLPRLGHRVDILYMNPPYAVTPSADIGSQSIEASWAGGVDGREVIDAVLPLVPVRIVQSPLLPRRLLPSRSQRQPAAGGLRDHGVAARNAGRSRDAEASREGEADHTQVPEMMVRRMRGSGIGGRAVRYVGWEDLLTSRMDGCRWGKPCTEIHRYHSHPNLPPFTPISSTPGDLTPFASPRPSAPRATPEPSLRCLARPS
ncbi:hypothetical protein BC936DRAFT_137434 [Jimgerdemannia flammicorona]|uniref:S-adenosyl-L-methionine-dependent methyltransferase n=1 Tax=Jimgerdemannia flammicorona TaxID=994334 RepID=A0A433CXE5_9FUNG|nr:hypothetical protein BC936DRAFT_137434 [Jimgerdemannia flammicorona]